MTTPDRSEEPKGDNNGPWLKGPFQPLFVVLLLIVVAIALYVMVRG